MKERGKRGWGREGRRWGEGGIEMGGVGEQRLQMCVCAATDV